MKVLFFLTSKLVVTNCPDILPGIIFVFVRAQKSNSIPLYYNTSRASSQENFQIFLRTFVRTEHMFFYWNRTYVLYTVKFIGPAATEHTFVAAAKAAKSSCKNSWQLQISILFNFLAAANYKLFQFFNSCKL